MKKYDVKKCYAEINYKERSAIERGCTINRDEDPELIESFDNLEDAIKKLKECGEPSCSFCKNAVSFYGIIEYLVEIYEVNEDGEYIDGSDYDSVYDYFFDLNNGNIEVSKDERFWS